MDRSTMTDGWITAAIVNGMHRYLELLGGAPHMAHHAGDIQWISPRPGRNGASLVYGVRLAGADVEARIDGLIREVRERKLPSVWALTPLDTPANLIEILLSRGFKDSYNPQEPEPGMAIWAADFTPDRTPPGLDIVRAATREEFGVWARLVNEELFGAEVLSGDGHWYLMERGTMPCYLAMVDGAPVVAASTLCSGTCASLEFVATKRGFRRRGFGRALCSEMIRELQAEGAELITLRASAQGAPLYRAMGFKEYYDTHFVAYEPAADTAQLRPPESPLH